MIIRDLQKELERLSKIYPVVTITGPRQAGKTTLAKNTFPDYSYCNLEHPETRSIAISDPKSLFNLYPAPVIIDEIQKVPELLSYIQVIVDEQKTNGMYILTGSQQLLLNASITQSLAGRTALLTLLPFSIKELNQSSYGNLSRDGYLFKGFLPRIYDQGIDPVSGYRNYLQTYVERDVRQLINVRDLTSFENFLRLLAGRVGQLINMTSLANDTGVSVTTISQWLSVLEASYIILRISPYYENLGKRIIKSPKLYFTEPGLACYLLGIENEAQLTRDPLIGNLFENMVVAEALKSRTNKGLEPNLYFYRDSHHKEIDLLFKRASELIPIEIKASSTYNHEFSKNLKGFIKSNEGYVIYSGSKSFKPEENINALSFYEIFKIFEN